MPNVKYKVQNANRQGFALIATTIITALLLLAGSYFISLSTTDIKIASAHRASIKTYALAQAGANAMIRRIQDDPILESAFIAGTLSTSISRSAVFEPADSYNVSAQSTAPGAADIISTGRYQLGDNTAARTITVTFAERALGDPEQWALPLFAGGLGGQQNGNVTIEIPVNIAGGNVHANQNFKVQGATVTVTNGNVTASNNILVLAGGTLNIINGTQQTGVAEETMPVIDFSSDLPNSKKNRASETYTAAEFSTIPSGSTLSGIIYVSESLSITNQTLTINGQLVVNGDLTINNPGNWITINDALEGSGILVLGSLVINSSLTVQGALYSQTHVDMNVTEPNAEVDLTGGIVGWRVTIHGRSDAQITINYNQEFVSKSLDPNYTTALIEDHWAENY